MPRAPKRCGREGCTGYGRPYCDTHTREQQQRANTASRGYDAEHQAQREHWAPTVAAGRATCHAEPCWRDTRTIRPGERWHMGHTDDRTAWTGPEHQLCNTRNAARSKAATRR